MLSVANKLSFGLLTSLSKRFLLNLYEGAAAAYSLQRLDTSTENVVRARRSTDDAEADFTAQEVAGGSLREFSMNNDADLIRFADQAAAADERMYFDGSNDDVVFSAFDLAGAVLRFTFLYVSGEAQILQINDDANTGNGLAITQNNSNENLTFRLFQISGNTALDNLEISTLTENTLYDVVVTMAGDGNSFSGATIGGVSASAGGSGRTQGTATANEFHLGIREDGSFPYTGLIYDVSVDGLHQWNGYGNTNADWEDQVGSNDGTVNGSPALFSGQGFDAFVTTLYDQSGNGRNATQSTAASQPQIVADGVVVTDSNGNPSMDFDGSDDYLVGVPKSTISNTSIFTVFSAANTSQDSVILQTSVDVGNTVSLGLGDIGTASAIGARLRVAGSSISTIGDNTFTNTNPTIASYVGTSSSAQIYIDGVEETDTVSSRSGGSDTTIGSRGDGQSNFEGSITEVVFYDTTESTNRAAIEANIANRYGITLA